MSGIEIHVEQNEFLPATGRTVDAIVTITGSGPVGERAALRLWTAAGSTTDQVRQVLPAVEDLTASGTRVDARHSDYPIGARPADPRKFHVRITVPPGKVGEDMRAGRVRARRRRRDHLPDQHPRGLDRRPCPQRGDL